MIKNSLKILYNTCISTFLNKSSHLIEIIFQNHAGLSFSILTFFLSLWLFGWGYLIGFDDFLQALIFQIGYPINPPIRTEFLIVKKDEKTSSLISKNPGRSEFASIIQFLGKGRKYKISHTGNFGYRSAQIFEFQIGKFEVEDGMYIYLPTLENLGLYVSSSPSFILFEENLQRVFDEFLLEDLKPPWTKNADNTTSTKIISWDKFIWNILAAKFSITINVFPTPESLFQIRFKLTIEESEEFYIPPPAVIGMDFILQGTKTIEEDSALIKSISEAECPVVLAAELMREKRQINRIQINAGDLKDINSNISDEQIFEILPHPQFNVGKAEIAYINAVTDQHGYLTRIPMFQYNQEKDTISPAFSLLIAALYLDSKSTPPNSGKFVKAMQDELNKIKELLKKGEYKGGFHLLDRYLPLDNFGNLHILFVGSTKVDKLQKRGSAVFPSVSFYECFTEETLNQIQNSLTEKKPELLPQNAHLRIINPTNNYGGKIILAGPTEKTDFDFYPSPLTMQTPFKIQDELLAGIEFHANAIANIIDGKCLSPPNPKMTIILLALSLIIFGLLLDHLKPLAGGLFTVLFLGGISYYSYYSYHVTRQIFYFSPFLISFPFSWALTTLVNYVRYQRKAKETKALFQRFVSPEVVQYLIDNPSEVKPGGQKVELTIFFSDLAGFTTISESLSPEDLVVLMNEYLGEMTEILFKHGGTLDKYIGDAVMAYWNFPQKQEDHAIRACLYTLEMHEKLAELQADWKKRGLPKAYARAGMNTAKVVVGCMGSKTVQMNFTCLGDGVNLASRLEGANKEYGTLYMISESTYQQAKSRIRARFLDFLAVKGKKEPVKVYELVSELGKEPPGFLELLKLYDEAIQLHLERKWDAAIAVLQEILSRWPNDGPSQTYLKRVYEYKENPPPEDWDGRYILTHK